MIIATHSGNHHADDVIGVMVLMTVFADRSPKIIRTRDPRLLASADAAVDVGGVSDASTLRFDHHQKTFCEQRQSGVGYASAGLVWKEYGEEFVFTIARSLPVLPNLSSADAIDIARTIDDELIKYIDMVDIGVEFSAPGLFGLSAILSQFTTTLVDEEGLAAEFRNDQDQHSLAKNQLQLERFLEAVEIARLILAAAVRTKISEARSVDLVRKSQRIEEGKILILCGPDIDWKATVHREMQEVLFVVYPDSIDAHFHVQTVTLDIGSFINKRSLPAEWAGLRDRALSDVTGIPDCVFCHTSRFIAGSHSLDGAVKLAKIALADRSGK